MSGAAQARVALITGGADGVGRGIARRMAQAGHRVIIADKDAPLGQQTADQLVSEGYSARFLGVDVTDKDSVGALMANAGPVDILVNNAWRGHGVARLENKTDAQFQDSLRMGIFACLWTMRAVLPHMKAQHWGRIINIASLNGVNAHIGSADYNAAKEGLRALTRTAAREWAGYGICANIICPAAMVASTQRILDAQPGMIAAINAANPMGRMGDPEADIGGVALFLASEDARYLTGNTLFVDGGAHIIGVAWTPNLED